MPKFVRYHFVMGDVQLPYEEFLSYKARYGEPEIPYTIVNTEDEKEEYDATQDIGI